MNKYFKLNFVNAWMCSPSLSEPHLNFRPTCGRSTGCQWKLKWLAVEVSVLRPREFWWFPIGILQRTTKNCKKFKNAHAELLFCPLIYCYCHVQIAVLVAVVVRVCFRSSGNLNRPFYSYVLSCQAFDLEWGWRWPCCDRDQYLVSVITK